MGVDWYEFVSGLFTGVLVRTNRIDQEKWDSLKKILNESNYRHIYDVPEWEEEEEEDDHTVYLLFTDKPAQVLTAIEVPGQYEIEYHVFQCKLLKNIDGHIPYSFPDWLELKAAHGKYLFSSTRRIVEKTDHKKFRSTYIDDDDGDKKTESI